MKLSIVMLKHLAHRTFEIEEQELPDIETIFLEALDQHIQDSKLIGDNRKVRVATKVRMLILNGKLALEQ